ncbi:MAG: glycosyltransferase family 4 protein [Bacteroidota bacterium]
MISVGKNTVTPLKDESYIQIGAELDRKKDKKEIALLLLEFLNNNGYDILVPMNSPITISIIPFLNSDINVIQIVNSDTPRVYKYVTSHLAYISKIICISEKQVSVLSNYITDVEDKLVLIPHGVKKHNVDVKSNKTNKLVIGYLGRLHQGHKGILTIPEVLKQLNFAFDFQIIGDGGDKDKFIQQLDLLGIDYTYYGFKDQDEILTIASKWDVLMFPSVIEGFGLTLIETMRLGIVPLANRIAGVTNYIVQDAINGFIIDTNQTTQYAKYINLLNTDRELLHQMKQAAKDRVDNCFNIDDVLRQYKNVFEGVKDFNKAPTVSTVNWVPYVEYKPSLYHRFLNKINRLFESVKA